MKSTEHMLYVACQNSTHLPQIYLPPLPLWGVDGWIWGVVRLVQAPALSQMPSHSAASPSL